MFSNGVNLDLLTNGIEILPGFSLPKALEWRVSRQQELDQFLRQVQQRAYHMALTATGEPADALDIVQEAMLKLCSKYSMQAAEEWTPLFYRILYNQVTDFHRRQVRHSRFNANLQPQGDAEDYDALQQHADPVTAEPGRHLQQQQGLAALQQSLAELPLRQQQAFYLRFWEGLDVAKTANSMQCSEGSVKTHYSRAMQRLREKLEGSWP